MAPKFQESDDKLKTLDLMCQFLTKTPEEQVELQAVLREAPVTIVGGISDPDDDYRPNLAYLVDSDTLFQACSDELKDLGDDDFPLWNRKYHRCVEIVVDISETISRDYSEAEEEGFKMTDYEGETVFGIGQLAVIQGISKNIEIYSQKDDGKVLVAYIRDDKEFLIAFQLYDRETFDFIQTNGASQF